MSQFKPLIKDQKIKFEDHQRGSTQPSQPENLHMHKTFHSGRWRGVQVRIPIGREGKVKISGAGANRCDKEAILREIRRALRPSVERARLVDEVLKQLRRFSNGAVTEDQARDAARRLAGHFGLNPDFIEEIVHRFHSRICRLITVHLDTAGPRMFIITQTDRYISLRQSPEKFEHFYFCRRLGYK